MQAGREKRRSRAGPCGMHVVRMLPRARHRHAHDDRHHHQSGTVSRGHQERPDREPTHAHAHAAPARVAMTNHAQDAERDEQAGNWPAQPADWHHESDRECQSDRTGHRKRMPGTEWQERPKHGVAATLLHPERHRKQPSHTRIDAVKGAQRHQHHPRRRHLARHDTPLRWSLVLGAWYLVLHSWSSDLGPWTLDLGPWTTDGPRTKPV